MFKKIIYYLLILIGVLGILDTILVIPISTGIGYGTLMPAGIGLCLIVFAVIKLCRKEPILKEKIIRRMVTLAICLCILVFAVAEGLIIGTAIAHQKETKEANYVIVLGCGIFSDGRLTLTLMNRLDAAIDYLTTYPDALCIVSGGQGPKEPTTEAFAMKEYLVSKNISPERILLEDQSTSTKENLVYSAKVMAQHDPDRAKTAAVVTNDFHIFRSIMLAKHHGINATGISCPTPWYVRLNCYLREFLALFKSLILDMR